MHSSVVSSLSARPPDNELDDRGCDLVEAAASIRRLAGDPRAARALTDAHDAATDARSLAARSLGA